MYTGTVHGAGFLCLGFCLWVSVCGSSVHATGFLSVGLPCASFLFVSSFYTKQHTSLCLVPRTAMLSKVRDFRNQSKRLEQRKHHNKADTKNRDSCGGFIKGVLRGVRCTKSLRALFLHRRPPSWATLVLYSRAVFIF